MAESAVSVNPASDDATPEDVNSILQGQGVDLKWLLTTLAAQKAQQANQPPPTPVNQMPPMGGQTPPITGVMPNTEAMNPSNESLGLHTGKAVPQGLPPDPQAQPKSPLAVILAQRAANGDMPQLDFDNVGMPTKNPFRQGAEDTTPSVGKAVSKASAGSGGGGGGKVRSPVAAALSSPQRDNENGALNAGLLSFVMNVLFKPQWSLGDSITSALSDAADTYTNYMGQRSQEVKDQQESELTKAKIGEIGASTTEKYAQAAKAKSGIGVDNATIKQMLAVEKNSNPQGLLPQSLDLQKSLDHKIDPTLSEGAPDMARQALEAAQAAKIHDDALRKQYGIGDSASVAKAQQAMGNGTLDMATLQAAFPKALVNAKVNPKAATALRAWMSKNPTELVKLNQALK